jgi:PDZ domain-containing secreted protein/Zn-dependent protease/CBS domain-containing protein
MESSFRLFRFRGIDIGANWSWVLIFAFIVWSLARQIFPTTYPDLETSTYFVMAVVTAVIFFVSLLLHELGHALRALKEGMEIDGITLWFFGGVARFKGMFPSAGAEFRIAIAGPLVTVVLMLFFFGANWLLTSVDAPAEVVGVVDYLAWINSILLAFNMVPALPLDGGRVLRSYLWYRQGNFTGATISAAKAGRAFGWVLISVGLLLAFTRGDAQGLWFAFIGWFLIQAARAEVSFAQFRHALRGLRVRELMSPDPEIVEPGRSINEFIEDVAHARGHSTYPVVDKGRLEGLVSLRLAARVPAAERLTKTVRDVMVQADAVPMVDPDDDVTDAVVALQQGPGRAVVVDGGRVVGILSGSDIARALEIEKIRGAREVDTAQRRTPLIVWIIIIGLIVAAGGYLYAPPVAVVAPGKSFDISGDVEITGMRTDDVNGEYLLTSVAVEQPNLLGLAVAVITSRDLVPLSALGVPRDGDTRQFFEQQRAIFRETQLVAAAAAARAAGLDVEIRGTGAEVSGIVPGSPAADALKEGDVIVAVDGRDVRLADDVGEVIRSRPSGTRFVLAVERDGRKLDVEVRSRAGIIEGRPGIGIQVETRDFDIALPFEVRFADREIGGPSAGITYALAVYDILVPDDIARGRSIASTGEIDLEGRVGPIGGLEEKAIAAERAGADIFIVPEAEVEQARGSGLDVQGVKTLKEAIDFLKSRNA